MLQFTFVIATGIVMVRFPRVAMAVAGAGLALFLAFWVYLIAAMFGGFGPYRVGS